MATIRIFQNYIKYFFISISTHTHTHMYIYINTCMHFACYVSLNRLSKYVNKTLQIISKERSIEKMHSIPAKIISEVLKKS